MKKYLIGLAAFAMLGLTGCYNDDDLWGAVDSLDERVTTIEQQLKNLNGDIATIRDVVYFHIYKGSLINGWNRWDLSGLGKVVTVRFNMGGTIGNNYGFASPAYFAYDDVAVAI